MNKKNLVYINNFFNTNVRILINLKAKIPCIEIIAYLIFKLPFLTQNAFLNGLRGY